MEIIKLTLIGMVLGITTVLPGLSAGTMAIVFNVYERLIGVITPNVKKILAAWKFWLPLVVGGVTGIFLFSKTLDFLYENYPFPTMWFFIGIIAGSIPLVYNRVRKPSSALPSLRSIICAVLALAVMVLMAVISPDKETTVYTSMTLFVGVLLVLGGVLAAIAMIIPGISGSFLLLVIGLYRTVLQSVSDMNIPFLILFALGAGTGLFLGAGFVRFLLAKVPRETYGAVLGLVVGSIFVLFPGGFGDGIMIIFSAASLLAGSAISFLLAKYNAV